MCGFQSQCIVANLMTASCTHAYSYCALLVLFMSWRHAFVVQKYFEIIVLVNVSTVASSGPQRCGAIPAATPNCTGIKQPYREALVS